MNITQLIQQLEAVRAEYGDIKIYVPNNDENWGNPYLSALDVIPTIINSDGERGAVIS